MQFLIQRAWVEGEAALLGIEVSDDRVRRSLERQKRAAFRSEREYRRFLESSGMTEEMILQRVRGEILQSRLAARAVADIEPSDDPRVRARRQQRALDRYIADFRARWLSITRCARDYRVRECGMSTIWVQVKNAAFLPSFWIRTSQTCVRRPT